MSALTEYDATNKKTGENVKVRIEENCCIEHDGKTFCSGGAAIYPDHIVAYIKRTGGGLIITTWGGETISDRAFYGERHPWGYTYVHFYYGGRWWIGREIENGDLMRARPIKS